MCWSTLSLILVSMVIRYVRCAAGRPESVGLAEPRVRVFPAAVHVAHGHLGDLEAVGLHADDRAAGYVCSGLTIGSAG